MEQELGRCSLCGGPVMGFVGAWGATVPPPAPKCAYCGAVPKSTKNVIEMTKDPGKGLLVE